MDYYLGAATPSAARGNIRGRGKGVEVKSDSGAVSSSGAYYVYARLDPRENPMRHFYLGKGVGGRKDHHTKNDGETAKNKRIDEIEAAGYRYKSMELVSNLSEDDAYIIEALLIAAFGIEGNGTGVLTNKVQPAPVRRSKVVGANIRPGAAERVQAALSLIKDEIVAMAEINPRGITNADVANKLGLQSSHDGKQINFLSHSLLGLLMMEQRIMKSGTRANARYWSPQNYVDDRTGK